MKGAERSLARCLFVSTTMALPTSKAQLGKLDEKCADRLSTDSKRTVVKLAALGLRERVYYLNMFIQYDFANLVRCILETSGVSIETPCPEDSPLLLAAGAGAVRTLKLLLSLKPNLEAKDKVGLTALARTAQTGSLPCLQLLLAAGADANTRDRMRCTPLMTAVVDRRVEIVKVLIPVSDLRATGTLGRNAFHAAVMTASTECFELLLPLMDVDVRTVPGKDDVGRPVETSNGTALHIACEKGLQSFAKTLLKHDADRMARDNTLMTPLHWAAHGNLTCVILLVGRPEKPKMSPAEVNAVDANNCTALHYAAIHGHDKICGFLISAGARLDVKSRFGHTPLEMAWEGPYPGHRADPALIALLSGASAAGSGGGGRKDAGPAPLPGTVCDQCGKTAEQASATSLKTCSSCHAARYCSAACGAAAWPGHKKACKAEVAERAKKTAMKDVRVE